MADFPINGERGECNTGVGEKCSFTCNPGVYEIHLILDTNYKITEIGLVHLRVHLDVFGEKPCQKKSLEN